jgi:hypothetical protein
MRVIVPNRSGDQALSITLAEEIQPIVRAAKWLPARRGDRPTHASCLFRWAKHGLRGVRLETLRVGGTLCTSREALERFFARLAEKGNPKAAALCTPVPAPSQPDSRRQREIAEAAVQAEVALR